MKHAMLIPFIKMHGIGNDFVIVDGRAASVKLDPTQRAALANRRTGIGCDQLILMEPSKKADIFMRIYNSDGGEVASCGNATRCVAWLVMEETGKKSASIETKAGILLCDRADADGVCVDMGEPKFDWKDIPLAKQADTLNLPITAGNITGPVAVSMGNPHMVFIVADVDAVNLAELGPKLEHHALFPERVNVSIAQVTGKDAIRLRVWERGAGLTLACGTAACATLAALHKRNLIGNSAKITLPGGTLHVTWDKSLGHILMTGPVATSFTGTVEL